MKSLGSYLRVNEANGPDTRVFSPKCRAPVASRLCQKPPADEVPEEACGGAAGLHTRTPHPDWSAGWVCRARWLRMVPAGAMFAGP